MKPIPISPKQDFLDRVGTAAPIKAVSELIWNGLDAKANCVEVSYKFNGCDVLDEITVKDDGVGIDASNVEILFGGIGESWKRTQDRFGGRTLHGKKGEGRFKAFSLGDFVEWRTTYKAESYKKFIIKGHGHPCSFSYSDIEDSFGPSQTEVVISNLKDKGLGSLTASNALQEFARIFALYLSKNPTIQLIINGQRIIPSDYCRPVVIQSLQPIKTKNGKTYDVILEILDWSQPIEREISLCDSSGIELHAVDARLRAKGLNFTVQLKSDYFAELANDNLLILEDLEPSVNSLIEEAREYARGYVRTKKAEEQANIVSQWKEEDIYPYKDKADLSPVERAERQVFDIIGVNVEDYLPAFEAADKKQKKFTFRLLAQAITNNPESLQTIITDVLDLKKEAQDELADLLKKTDLASVIKSAKTVANRLDFLVGLKNLLFDKETKNSLLERDQLHKILEREAWLFDENFTLTVSEATLEDVLKLHLDKLGRRADDDRDVRREDGGRGRVDLMFSLSNKPRIGQTDHLIVELKRPSKKIDIEVLNQIQSYAFAVADDPRFDKASTHWKFIVVSDGLDSYAEKQAHQKDRPVGQVFVDDDNRIEVWALEWSSVIHDAEARLQFINQTLSYNADRESAKAYLTSKYEQFIPKTPTKMQVGKKARGNGEIEQVTMITEQSR